MTVPRLFVRLAMLWAFLLPLSGLRAPGGVGSVADLVLFGSAPLVWLWVAYRPELRARILAVMTFTVWLTSIVMITASFFAVDAAESRINVVKFGAALSLIYCLLFVVQRQPGSIEQVLWSFVAGSTVLAVSTWVMPAIPTADGETRAIGLAGHPVEVGCLIAVAVCLAALLQPPNYLTATARWVVLVVLASAFASSLALTGVLATILGISFALVRSGRLTLKGFALTMLATGAARWVAVSVPAAAYLVDKFNRSFSGEHEQTPGSNTFESRIETIKFGWDRIADHWLFGNGLDNAGQISLGTLGPHNILVMSWQTGGVLIAAVVVTALVLSVRAITGPMALGSVSVPTQSALRAAVFATWTQSMTGPDLYRRVWMFPVLMVIVIAGQTVESRRQAASDQGQIRGRIVEPVH